MQNADFLNESCADLTTEVKKGIIPDTISRS